MRHDQRSAHDCGTGEMRVLLQSYLPGSVLATGSSGECFGQGGAIECLYKPRRGDNALSSSVVNSDRDQRSSAYGTVCTVLTSTSQIALVRNTHSGSATSEMHFEIPRPTFGVLHYPHISDITHRYHAARQLQLRLGIRL